MQPKPNKVTEISTGYTMYTGTLNQCKDWINDQLINGYKIESNDQEYEQTAADDYLDYLESKY